MNPESMAFSAAPDRSLGRALRGALGRPGQAAFVATLLQGAEARGVGSSRAVLGRWTAGAIVAALVAALAANLPVGAETPTSPTYEAAWVTAATGSPAAGELFTAPRAPDAAFMLAPLGLN
jgi:hypothetical protein